MNEQKNILENLKNKKRNFIYLSLIIIISAVLGFGNLYKGHVWGDDHALYLRQTKSIVEGNLNSALIDNSYNIENSDHPVGPKLCTWGFPFVLVPIYYFLGLNIQAMKISLLVFFLMSLIVFFGIFKNKLGNNKALLMVLLFAVNPYLLEFNNFILSDMPYMLFSLVSIFLIDKFIFEKRFYVNKVLSLCLLGLSIFLAYFIRSNGLFLIVILFLCDLIEKKKTFSKIGSSFIPYIVFIALAALVNLLLPEGIFSHLSFLRNLSLKQLLVNIIYYIKIPSEFFGVQLRDVIYGTTLPFAIFGILKNFKKDYHYIFYTFVTVLAYVFWPQSCGLRYFFPILPFYVYFFLDGFLHIEFKTDILLKVFTQKVRITSILILVVLLFIQSSYAALIRTIDRKAGKIVNGHSTIDSKELFDFISQNTEETDVIIFFKPRIMNLISDRKSIIITDPFLSSRGEYLVTNKLDDLSNQVTDEYPRNQPEKFEIVFENNHFKVYKINKFTKR